MMLPLWVGIVLLAIGVLGLVWALIMDSAGDQFWYGVGLFFNWLGIFPGVLIILYHMLGWIAGV